MSENNPYALMLMELEEVTSMASNSLLARQNEIVDGLLLEGYGIVIFKVFQKKSA